MKMTKQEILDAMADGVSVVDIAKMNGVTRARVYAFVSSRGHLHASDICIYKGLSEWMRVKGITIRELTRLIYGNDANKYCVNVRNVIVGKKKIPEVIDAIVEITQMPYEICFKRRDLNGK